MQVGGTRPGERCSYRLILKTAIVIDVEGGTLRNIDVDWSRFQPNRYRRRHYRSVRDDDRRILAHTRDHFAAHNPVTGAVGLEVGPGANLYPSLAMLPFCSRLDLVEYSPANVRWLRRRAAWPWWRFDR